MTEKKLCFVLFCLFVFYLFIFFSAEKQNKQESPSGWLRQIDQSRIVVYGEWILWAFRISMMRHYISLFSSLLFSSLLFSSLLFSSLLCLLPHKFTLPPPLSPPLAPPYHDAMGCSLFPFSLSLCFSLHHFFFSFSLSASHTTPHSLLSRYLFLSCIFFLGFVFRPFFIVIFLFSTVLNKTKQNKNKQSKKRNKK